MPENEPAKIEESSVMSTEIMKPVVHVNIKSAALKAKKAAVSAVISIRTF